MKPSRNIPHALRCAALLSLYAVIMTACLDRPGIIRCDEQAGCRAGYECYQGACIQPDVCGNGILEPGEVCDDGNNTNGDGCSADCLSNETCGNDTVDSAAGEVCDDGNNTNGDGCSADCRSFEGCGNGILDPSVGEVCDDGNNTNGDGCSVNCRSDESCGNDIVDSGEVCDDGNIANGDGCSANCRSDESCGNDIVDSGEVCDDGNNTNGDGCSADCRSTETCGNELVESAVGEICDDGNNRDGDGCSANCRSDETCGNGVVDDLFLDPLENEACDDGNDVSGDGCEADCTVTGPVEIVTGGFHTCVRLWTGAVRCWGRNDEGQLGYGNTVDRLSPGGNVAVGGPVIQLVAGHHHTCALLEGGTVRCWGRNNEGQLGYGHTNAIGDDELPSTTGAVNVGGTVVALAAGDHYICALLEGGTVRCWGQNNYGQLGYGHTINIGDNELPSTAGEVNVGGPVVAIGAGDFHTCALLGVDDGNAVRCWGRNDYGQLGYGNTSNLLAPGAEVNVGGPVIALGMGDYHTCVLLQSGDVRCWGRNIDGQLGYAHTSDIGDSPGEMPPLAGNVNVGGPVIALRGGDAHMCALLQNGAVRCWGRNIDGQLGYGNTTRIGDNEAPSVAGDVDLGEAVVALAAGEFHTCALLATRTVRCWGLNGEGQLGYGHTNNIGDNERPSSSTAVHIVDSQ